jgi:hypothetical protein
MAVQYPSASIGAYGFSCPRLLVAVMMLVGLTVQSRAFTAELREQSAEADVQRYYVSVRQPGAASGAPLAVGPAHVAPERLRQGAPRLEGMR